MYRLLSHTDILDLAEHLNGTDDSAEIALSEMGFDPSLYAEIESWLKEIHLIRDRDSCVWRFR